GEIVHILAGDKRKALVAADTLDGSNSAHGDLLVVGWLLLSACEVAGEHCRKEVPADPDVASRYLLHIDQQRRLGPFRGGPPTMRRGVTTRWSEERRFAELR